MNLKFIIGGLIVLAALVFGATSFLQTNVDYADFRTATASHRKTQVKGEWERNLPSHFDPAKGEFSFVMKDERGTKMQVVFTGSRPNNFELAPAVVVKGRVEGDRFLASEILTKCPSKYESGSGAGRSN